MNRGKWYLVYTYRDTFGGGLSGTIENQEVPLNATIEDEAIVEAKTKWDERVRITNDLWKLKAGWANPPKTAFDDGPWHPYVVYKISLQ